MKTLNLILILGNVLIYSLIFNSLFSKDFVLFPDIGQGSAVIIKDGKNVFLYDVGKESYKLLRALRNNLPFEKKTLDLVIISHPDKDHYQNIYSLLSKFKIRVLVVNPFFYQDEEFSKLIHKLKEKNQKIIILDDKDEIQTKNLKLKVIHPDKNYLKDNNNSLVLFVNFKNKNFLLMGDLEKEGILSLQKRYRIENVDFLLYPHHGSKNSLKEDFYKELKPQLVIIQSGYNYFGHPHKEVIDFFKKLEVKVWRTDIFGDLKINF